MKYVLAGKAGAAKGVVWPLTGQLTIGRDPACDVALNDVTVSRRHCTIEIEGDDVVLQDLGSSNSTLINGRPKRKVMLRPGDEIAVGTSLFLLCQFDGGASLHPAEMVEEPATSRVRVGDTVQMGSDGGGGLQGTPHTIEDLAEVFNVGRELSRASTVDGLITILLQRLSERFRPARLWVCCWQEAEDRLDIFPPSAMEEFKAEKELPKRVREVLRLRQPVLHTHPEKKYTPASMFAPIAAAREMKGVMVLEGDAYRPRYEEHDLDLLLSIANAAAPYFTVVERLEQLERENVRLIAGVSSFSPIIGSSSTIQQVRELARSCARSNLSILITGETGTGKELLARMIHELSDLSSKPMVTVNCAAIPEELFESELFGHERGSFTGAHVRKSGVLEECHGGTLFLDEVGDLSLQNQARLLRAIETKTFRRVGGSSDIKVDFRLISATNQRLHHHTETGRFRRDFYHRLAGLEIHLPPLRERRSDVPELVHYFLEMSRERHHHKTQGFTPEALQSLERRDWPGNIRELRNVVERAAVLAQHALVHPEDLVATIGSTAELGRFPNLAELEKHHIAEALRLTRGNVQEAAVLLDIGRSTLYRKIEEYGIALA
ncbi:MAG: sigma 54-interacting transcriptional regulator [Candidatus Hydrogenedentes bacterium]|nr:sigma 54-interacting transcriptional regulator [Candidatus Hydrogenedentota bacterium]